MNDVDLGVATAAQMHCDETGHEAVLLIGGGWLCKSCDPDWEDVAGEHEGERRALRPWPGSSPKRTAHEIKIRLELRPDQDLEEVLAAVLAQLEGTYWTALHDKAEDQPERAPTERSRGEELAWRHHLETGHTAHAVRSGLGWFCDRCDPTAAAMASRDLVSFGEEA